MFTKSTWHTFMMFGLLSGYGIWLLRRAERRIDRSAVIARQQLAADQAN